MKSIYSILAELFWVKLQMLQILNLMLYYPKGHSAGKCKFAIILETLRDKAKGTLLGWPELEFTDRV